MTDNIFTPRTVGAPAPSSLSRDVKTWIAAIALAAAALAWTLPASAGAPQTQSSHPLMWVTIVTLPCRGSVHAASGSETIAFIDIGGVVVDVWDAAYPAPGEDQATLTERYAAALAAITPSGTCNAWRSK